MQKYFILVGYDRVTLSYNRSSLEKKIRLYGKWILGNISTGKSITVFISNGITGIEYLFKGKT